MQYSVLVLEYNQSFETVKMTLDSILEQEGVELQIVICDDGSKENHFDEISAYFQNAKFENYVLVGDGINRGTVKNVLRGLRVSTGKYAKIIGSGDILYDKDVLRKVADFMKQEQIECCFGKTMGFAMVDGKKEERIHICPRDLDAYIQADRKRIVKNIVVAEDWVSGAAVFATKKYYEKYISMMEDKVIYCEDYAVALALVDHVFMKYFDEPVIWYEVSEGISTSPNKEFHKKLMKDNASLWELFDRLTKEKSRNEFDKYIKIRKRKKRFDYVENMNIQLALKALAVPELLLYELKCRKQFKKYKQQQNR